MLPDVFREIVEEYPEVSEAHREMAEACYRAGPLDRKTAHLIKLGMAIALKSEGAVHGQVRQAKKHGATDDEIRHVVLLSLSTLGWPAMGAAWSWINDEIKKEG
ncbi:MAG: carboxymuconolactone decarboxylase family protein [Methanobacteriota archaeon]|nr:MAG: carboxymuconolactone decarboxylase family protein [Euryarchaeota archaeon]